MALKQRKQITGTTEQINQYAGVEGQLVWDKTSKTLVGMSGTAGKNYPLATKALVVNEVSKVNTEVTKKADKTYVDQELAKKVTQDYVDKEINNVSSSIIGVRTDAILKDEVQTSSYKLSEEPLEDSDRLHTVLFPEPSGGFIEAVSPINIENALIKSVGNRGALRGYENIPVIASSPTISEEQYDVINADASINVLDGVIGHTYTKVVYMQAGGSVSLGSKWKWAGGNAPTLKFPGILVCHWNSAGGIANYIAGAS